MCNICANADGRIAIGLSVNEHQPSMNWSGTVWLSFHLRLYMWLDRFRLTAHTHNIYVGYKFLVSTQTHKQFPYIFVKQKKITKPLHSCRSANDHLHTCFVGWKIILLWKTKTAKDKESERERGNGGWETSVTYLRALKPALRHLVFFVVSIPLDIKVGSIWKSRRFHNTSSARLGMWTFFIWEKSFWLIFFTRTHTHAYSHPGVQKHNPDWYAWERVYVLSLFSHPPEEQSTKFFFSLQLLHLRLLLLRVGVLICLILTKDCGNQKRTQYIYITNALIILLQKKRDKGECRGVYMYMLDWIYCEQCHRTITNTITTSAPPNERIEIEKRDQQTNE